MREFRCAPVEMIRVAVIGAGASGLTTTKLLTEDSEFDCITFEQSNSVGGTWVYTDKVGKNDYGLPVHSSMYKGLVTNLPIQIMSLPGLPFKSKSGASYVPSDEVLEYFMEYVDHFGLRNYIKLQHHVKSITPMENGRWEIKVTDLVQQKDMVYHFDAVIICPGNYSNPVIPNYPNREKFKGIQFHSHDYRHPSRLQDLRALVIGAGSSALDVTSQGSQCAKEIYLSHHKPKLHKINFPENVTHKPDVRELRESSVIFQDGSEVEVDAIVYCTGYEHKFPYLDPSCGIRVEEGVVKPLYKHFVNIAHPTMFFVGIPRDCPGFTMFQLQAQCCRSILKGQSSLPSKSEMYADFNKDLEERTKSDGNMRRYHQLNKVAEPYFDWLSELAKLPKTPRIMFEIYFKGSDFIVDDFYNFRNRIFHIYDLERYSTTMLRPLPKNIYK